MNRQCTRGGRLSKGGSLLAVSLAAGIGAASHAAAQEQPPCAMPPAPVPWLSGAPTWAPGDLFKQLNDPRWGSSPLRSFANDSGQRDLDEGGYRLVVSGTELSVSIQNRSDIFAAENDYAMIGIYVPGGKRVAAKLMLRPGGAPLYFRDGTSVRGDATLFEWIEGCTNANLALCWRTTTFPIPAANTTLPRWMNPDSIGSYTTQTVADGGANWGIQFKLNLGTLGIDATKPFKIFLGMHDQFTDAEGTSVGTGLDLTTPALVPGDATPAFVPDTVIWADAERWANAATLGAGCKSGLYFANHLAIGVKNNDPANNDDSKIDARDARPNRFFAKLSGGGSDLAREMLVARFRYANWGSEPPEPAKDGETWLNIGGGGAVLNGVQPKGKASTPTTGLLTDLTMNPVPPINEFWFDCPTNGGGLVCGGTKPRAAKQCMTVDFSPAPGKKIDIMNASIYRNMTFEGLSSRTLPAEISMVGITRLTKSNADRDVVVRIVTRNMPENTDLPMFLDSALLNTLKMAVLGVAQLFNPLGLSLTESQLMKIAWPTYEVHVYYDTGHRAKNKGKEYKIMSPMNAFGYYLSHSGVFYGYMHGFGGGGFATQKQGSVSLKNSFVARLKPETVANVTTGIQTHDVPRFLNVASNLLCAVFPFACPGE